MKRKEARDMELPTHMMIDVEALRLSKPWMAPLMEIGLAVFSSFGTVIWSGKIHIHPDEDISNVLPEESTIEWWNMEDKLQVWKELLRNRNDNGVTPREAIEWMNDIYKRYNVGPVWFAGPQYDKIILENYQNETGVKQAFRYNDVRDFRTIRKQHPDIELTERDATQFHDAEQDAIFQVEHLRKITEAKDIIWL